MKLNTKKIFAFISIIVISTICLQLYWNYKNYILNEERLRNEIQIAYDNSLEIYFDEASKETFISVFSTDSTVQIEDFIAKIKTDSFFGKKLKEEKKSFTPIKKSTTDMSFKLEDTENNIKKPITSKKLKVKDLIVLKGKKAIDSIGGVGQFPNKITMSFVNDTVKYKTLDSIFKTELERKNIVLNYEFNHLKKDSLFYTYLKKEEKLPFKIKPNSTYLKPKETIILNYKYSSKILIKRISNELMLSIIFSIAVISCLFFLLYIIKKQKRVDEIKNDFINNITHEFKTPITTIAIALEGMSKFNPENDSVKNKKYISMSFNQLHKLESMVEKILETATLNTNELQLNLEEINLTPFIESIIKKHQDITYKQINFIFNTDEIFLKADPFYLENAISNLIDNAIKYGGNFIELNCYKNEEIITIDIKDNGNSILKSQEKKIFEKFYRVPKGNIHDVKGYGIGLYYTKSIIQKHNGTIELIRTNNTIFRINLPNEYKN